MPNVHITHAFTGLYTISIRYENQQINALMMNHFEVIEHSHSNMSSCVLVQCHLPV